ncbi:hypothetical protein GEV27_10545 [Aeromicrobium sp. S22]|uniref:hypothetical protein n=1 Tax=Aeromicrobium sp. S22 TaxID=2662029 RepID=UPI00129D4D99|nr:hypothetical protein [Aeromicrobium sp. S22]MRK01961.1 hypothetical protein [Aeromicrobium sp. S22]
MLEIVIDNDVLLKTARYGVVDALDHIDCADGCPHESGILGAARFVVGKRLDRLARRGDIGDHRVSAWREALPRFIEVEPTDDELRLSAEMEENAIARGLELDGGESQLVAIAIMRGEAIVLTGDKRAVVAVEQLMSDVHELASIAGRVASFEQAVRQLATSLDVLELRASVCADRAADTAVYVCFKCTDPTIDSTFEPKSLESYIRDQRASAPIVMFPGDTLTLASP